VLFCPSCSMILSIDPAAGVKAFQMREPPVAGAALRPVVEALAGGDYSAAASSFVNCDSIACATGRMAAAALRPPVFTLRDQAPA
jgi:hypothetical protein